MNDEVEALHRRAARDPHVISLGGGLPAAAQFPRRELARAFLRVLDETGIPALQYGWAEGSERLRAFVAARLTARGAAVAAGDVIVTSGAQQAIAIALEVLCRPGDRVGVAPESYPAALDLLRTRRLLPVVTPALGGGGGPSASLGDRPTDVDGLTSGPSRPPAPPWPLRGQPLAAVYAMPAVANPAGGALPAEARRALLDLGGFLIEDDAYADLRFDGPAPPPLLAAAPERVFHVGTLSKTLCPGMRIGWLVAPARHRAQALRIKRDSDLQASSLAQAIAADYVARTDFDARLTRLRRFYRRRAELLAAALTEILPRWRFTMPEGGFSIWAHADADADETELLEEATRQGVSFDPGSLFRPDARRAPLALRLCFSAAPETSLREAILRLERAYRSVRRRVAA